MNDADTVTDTEEPAAAGTLDQLVVGARAAESNQIYRILGIMLAAVAGTAAVLFDLLALVVAALGITLLVSDSGDSVTGGVAVAAAVLALGAAALSHPTLRGAVTALRRPASTLEQSVALARRSGGHAREDLGRVGTLGGEFRRRPTSPRTWWGPVRLVGGFASRYLPSGESEPLLVSLARCTPAFLLWWAWVHFILVVVNLVLLAVSGYLVFLA